MTTATAELIQPWTSGQETPNLMGIFSKGEADAADVVAGFDAAFDWAMAQDFEPDHAERMRQEAWGDSTTE